METAAYYIALIMVVVSPPMICMWFIIHPFAKYWRRKGPAITYIVVVIFIVIGMFVIFLFREPLMAVHFGVKTPLVVIAGILFAFMLVIGIQLRRYLSIAAMLGLPEISKSGGKLLTEGIYSHIRHPRYVEVGLGVATTALLCNYLIGYILFFLYIPFIYIVVLIEEKELKDRFGKDYEEYCKKVPRFIPHISKFMKKRTNE